MRSRPNEFRNQAIRGFVFCVFAGLAHGADTVSPEASTPSDLSVVISAALFDDVNANDIRVSMKVWVETISSRQGIPASAHVTLMQSLDEIRDHTRADNVDLLVLTVTDALPLISNNDIDPLFVIQRGGSVFTEFLVLVRADSQIGSFADLPDRTIVIETTSRTNCLIREWTETVLREGGVTGGLSTLRSVREVLKTSRAVLPVFFGQADACVVSRLGFQTMVELNPQLGRELVPLAVSEGIVAAVVGMRPDYVSSIRSSVIEAMGEMHGDPYGQQIASVFQFEKLVPFEDSLLDSAVSLIERYDAEVPVGER